MKKTFEKAEIKIISFDNVDVLAASQGEHPDGTIVSIAEIPAIQNLFGKELLRPLVYENGSLQNTGKQIENITTDDVGYFGVIPGWVGNLRNCRK